MDKLRYHFQPEKGWMNDPNGLVFYKGRYHAFYQHNPHDIRWGPMHWGHAVSDDLIHWQELPIALTPTEPYELRGGCWSGSAVEKDGALYLFYTSVSDALGQTQSVAVSGDGVHFEKYAGNPVLDHFPPEGSADFRDPKVSRFGDAWHMVCGSGRDGCGRILHYISDDLIHWSYEGVLFEGARYGTVLECPDFFPFAGGTMLMFSMMGRSTHSTQFVHGDFDGVCFTPRAFFTPEAGPDFYAPQTFEAAGRRILIGWFHRWSKPVPEGAVRVGALTLPREMTLTDGALRLMPVKEAEGLLADGDEAVEVCAGGVTVRCPGEPIGYEGPVDSVRMLRDGDTVEVFINGGEQNISCWLK